MATRPHCPNTTDSEPQTMTYYENYKLRLNPTTVANPTHGRCAVCGNSVRYTKAGIARHLPPRR
jgi:hypothetical protein